jgi:hypothetical protein
VAKLSTHEVRELLETERDRVLSQLKALARKNAAARDKELARRRKFRVRVKGLMAEGKDLGVPITDMAQAVGVTRQMAHTWLREEQERAAPDGNGG